jgi:hypothetical protein
MPHYPRPFFRAPRGLLVRPVGREAGQSRSRQDAFKAYHGLMQQRADTPPAPVGGGRLVVVLVDEFLGRFSLR